MKTLLKALACLLVLAGAIAQSSAAGLVTQGTLQAALDLTGQSPGYATNTINNSGAIGGLWVVDPTNWSTGVGLRQNPINTSARVATMPSVITEPGGALALLFDGSATNALSLYSAALSAGGTNLWAASTLTGVNPHYSVEVWAMAPVLGAYSTMVSWGTTSTSSNEFVFGYGMSDGNVGGALNQGANTFNWGGGGAPAAGTYHHLVATYDGTTTTLYCDGVAVNSSTNLQGGTSFAPATNFSINIGSTRANGGIATGQGSGTGHARMHIAKVRVMDGVLSASDVLNNYNVDKATYVMTPSTLAAGHSPIHRYTFNNAPSAIFGTAVVPDVGTLANANATVYASASGSASLASFTGTKLHMEGGSPTNGAFVDLPTNLISSLSAIATNNGLTVGSPGYNSTPGTGTGQVTLEGWLTVRGHPNFWQTYFAFGDTTATNVASGSSPIGAATGNVVSGKIIGLAQWGQGGPGGLSTASNNIGQLTNSNGGYGGINMWLFQQNNNSPTDTKMDLNGNGDQFYGGYSNSVATGGTPVTDDSWYGYGQNQFFPFTMTHYACSWNEANGEIITYINGVETSRNITDKKFYMIYDRNCWLGRDLNNNNPTLEGDYDEFRIYSNVLSPAEVLGNYEVGPDTVNSAPLGTVSAVHFVRTSTTSNWVGTTAYFTVTADYSGGASGVNVFANGVTYSVDDSTVISLTPGMMRFLKPGTTTVHATYGSQSDALTIQVVPLAATLKHRYSFKAADSTGQPYDSIDQTDKGDGPGYPSGNYGYFGATWAARPGVPGDGWVTTTNGAASGIPGWIDFGPNLIDPNYNALTVEMWASFGAPGGTAPLFSFGDQRINPGSYPGGLLLSNLNGNGAPNGALPMRGRYYIEAYSRPNEVLNWSADDPGQGAPNGGTTYGLNRGGGAVLDNQTNVHIVAEYHPTGGFAKLWINGIPVNTSTNQYLPFVYSLVDNYNYVGLSVNSGYTDGGQLSPGVFNFISPTISGVGPVGQNQTTNNMTVDEFRIYAGILPQSNIVINLATGPNLIVNNPGNLNSVSLVTPSALLVNQSLQSSLSGTFDNVTNVNLFLYDTNSTVFSSDTSKLTISATGLLTGVATGSAYIVASYPGFGTTSNLVNVQSITPIMTHRWSFTTNTGPTVTNVSTNQTWDSIVGAFNATNFNNAYETNGHLVLNSNSMDFLQLPTSVIDSTYAVLSIEYWGSYTNGGTNASFTDVFGFGDVNNTTGFGRFYINFTEHDGNNAVSLHINPTDPTAGGAGETAVTSANGTGFDGKTNIQVVATFHPLAGFMQLYTNGVLVGTNTLSTVVPTALQLLSDQVSYIGKPLYTANGFLTATIDEFRIYKGLMSPLQVLVDAATGPDVFLDLQSTNLAPIGALSGISLNVPNTAMYADQSETISLNASFANVPSMNVYRYVPTLSGSPTFPVLTSGNSNVITVLNSNITAVGIGSTTLTATWRNMTSQTVTVTVQVPPGPVALKRRFSFNESVGASGPKDSVTGQFGTNQGAQTAFNGLGQLSITNAGAPSNWVDLPTPMLTNLSNATIEIWAEALNPVQWTRIFDFGESDTVTTANGLDYSYMTMNGNGQGISFRTKPIGATYAFDGGGPQAGATIVLRTNAFDYIALVFGQDAAVQSLYVNGTNYARFAGVTPLSSVNEVSDYLGRSHYSGDPGASIVFDEFRVSTNAKTQAEVLAQNLAGPNSLEVVPVSISNSPAGGGLLRLTWPVWGSRYGAVYSSPSLVSPVWTPIGGSPNLATNATSTPHVLNIVNWQDITPGAGNLFYSIRQ